MTVTSGKSYLLYGRDNSKMRLYLDSILDRISPIYTHIFGDQKSLGISDVHEIRRRISFSVAGNQAVIIHRADEMTEEAMQSILKTIEEPPNNTYFFLLSNSAELPDTILSRVESKSFLDSEDNTLDSDEIDNFFYNEIIGEKAKLEKYIFQHKMVPREQIERLKKCIRLTELQKTSRISPRYLIDSYVTTA